MVDHIQILLIGKATKHSFNNKDKKCSQYVVIVALNPEEIEKHPERITKGKLFINKYSWKEMNDLSEKYDSRKFVKR